MPQVLTTNAVILCPHGGPGTSISSTLAWSVNGGYVLVEGDAGTLACPFLPFPCTGYTLKSMGLNSTTIQGRKVILATDFQQSVTGLPLLITETNTTIDDSTPAPIPPGGQAPPLTPALADAVQPTIAAASPAVAFDSTTMLPPTVPMAFTLSSPFPLQWMLRLINEPPPGGHADVTNGMPPGLVVAPAGGAWPTPSLSVTATMTAPYMAALGVGNHDFYMVGVSQRGLSGYAKAVLTVS